MQTDTVSSRNTSFLIILMVLCGTVLSGGTTVKQDLWLAILLSGILFLPIIFIYSRICALFPGKGLYEIIQILLGRILGSAIVLLIACYATVITALLLRNFVEFTVVIALQDTPRIPLMIAILSVVLYLSWHGYQVLGRWSIIVCVMILANIIFTFALSLDTIDLSHMLPLMEHSIGEIISNAFTMGSIVIGETVLVMAMMGHLKKGDSPYRAYFAGISVGIIFFILVILRNLLILGPDMVVAAKFSAYMAVRIIHFGSFFERIESLISFSLILLGVTKMAFCLSAATSGVAKVLQVEERKGLLIPVSLLVLALCSVVFKSAFEMYEFIWAYRFYAFPIQVILPVILWVVAERRRRRETLIN